MVGPTIPTLPVPALRFAFEDRGGRRMFERLALAVRDLRAVWPHVIAAFKEQQEQLFAGQGAEAGGWDPLTPAYARWKAKHHPGRGILRMRGPLEAAVTGRSSDFVVIAQPLLLIAQVKTFYAAFLDRRRELSPRTDARVRAYTRIINEHIQRVGREAVRP